MLLFTNQSVALNRFQVISIHRSKEEIAENGLGFMVHDKQIRTLCGQIQSGEEQLFGYEVTVYRKWIRRLLQKLIFKRVKCQKVILWKKFNEIGFFGWLLFAHT